MTVNKGLHGFLNEDNVNVNRVIYGFCNGYFGRDDYNTKLIIAEGDNWIVCEYLEENDMFTWNRTGKVTFADFKNKEEKQERINEWIKER